MNDIEAKDAQTNVSYPSAVTWYCRLCDEPYAYGHRCWPPVGPPEARETPEQGEVVGR